MSPLSNLQDKWCSSLLRGEKRLEVRSYPLPEGMAGQRVWLVSTSGRDAVASLGDRVVAGDSAGRLVGWVTFSGYRLYVAPEPFEQDVHLHRVQPGTPYGWQPGVTRELFGWEVVEQGSLEVPAPLPSMRRLHRSVYVLDAQPCQAGHHGRA